MYSQQASVTQLNYKKTKKVVQVFTKKKIRIKNEATEIIPELKKEINHE